MKTKQWYVNICAQNKRYNDAISLNRNCRTRKEAIEVKKRIDEELRLAIQNQNHIFELILPEAGRQVPRTLFIRPYDYAVISTSIDNKEIGYKGKIGFSADGITEEENKDEQSEV